MFVSSDSNGHYQLPFILGHTGTFGVSICHIFQIEKKKDALFASFLIIRHPDNLTVCRFKVLAVVLEKNKQQGCEKILTRGSHDSQPSL